MKPDVFLRIVNQPAATDEQLPARQPPVPPDVALRWIEFEKEALPHMAVVFRYAMWLEKDRATAEDLVQETYVQALQSYHLYTAGTNCRAWLLKILFRRDQHRRRVDSRFRFVDDLADVGLPYNASMPQGLTEQVVLQALSRLPSSFQEVIVLSDVEDFTYKEIAATLEVPLGTVMSRLHRARKLMRLELSSFAQGYGIGQVNSTFQ